MAMDPWILIYRQRPQILSWIGEGIALFWSAAWLSGAGIMIAGVMLGKYDWFGLIWPGAFFILPAPYFIRMLFRAVSSWFRKPKILEGPVESFEEEDYYQCDTCDNRAWILRLGGTSWLAPESLADRLKPGVRARVFYQPYGQEIKRIEIFQGL